MHDTSATGGPPPVRAAGAVIGTVCALAAGGGILAAAALAGAERPAVVREAPAPGAWSARASFGPVSVKRLERLTGAPHGAGHLASPSGADRIRVTVTLANRGRRTMPYSPGQLRLRLDGVGTTVPPTRPDPPPRVDHRRQDPRAAPDLRRARAAHLVRPQLLRPRPRGAAGDRARQSGSSTEGLSVFASARIRISTIAVLGAALAYGAGFWLVLVHHAEGGHEAGEPGLLLHALRDGTLALPGVLAAVWLGGTLALGLVDRHGRLPARWRAGLLAAGAALVGAIVLAAGSPLHALFFSAEEGHGLPLALHLGRDTLLALAGALPIAGVVAAVPGNAGGGAGAPAPPGGAGARARAHEARHAHPPHARRGRPRGRRRGRRRAHPHAEARARPGRHGPPAAVHQRRPRPDGRRRARLHARLRRVSGGRSHCRA